MYRDRAEWIAVKVPAIVSRELFDEVQEKLRLHQQRYSTPVTHYLLSRLVQCGCCVGRLTTRIGPWDALREDEAELAGTPCLKVSDGPNELGTYCIIADRYSS